MIPLKYTGAVFDTSGYASAARNYIVSLIESGEIDLTVGVVSFEGQKTTHGALQQKIQPYVGRNVKHDIQIVHLTPENFPSIRVGGKYNIAYTVWETDKLPHKWVELCNIMDEIWVPSQWNVEVFKNSGVTRPIYCIPHIIEPWDMSDACNVTVANNDVYVFYSIFQWLERKNPVALLKAYLTEFNAQDKVALALKTYRMNTTPKEQQVIKEDIQRIKKSLQIDNMPSLLFFGELMPIEHMKGFHTRGDCFVLPHRAEGFGIPLAEAMSLGKPTIGTGYSGNTEFMNRENSFLIDYQETPVSGMIFPNYHGYMTWSEPDIMNLRKHMRYCYENRDAAELKGKRAAKYVRENLSSKKIGGLMIKRLKEIQEMCK